MLINWEWVLMLVPISFFYMLMFWFGFGIIVGYLYNIDDNNNLIRFYILYGYELFELYQWWWKEWVWWGGWGNSVKGYSFHSYLVYYLVYWLWCWIEGYCCGLDMLIFIHSMWIVAFWPMSNNNVKIAFLLESWIFICIIRMILINIDNNE